MMACAAKVLALPIPAHIEPWPVSALTPIHEMQWWVWGRWGRSAGLSGAREKTLMNHDTLFPTPASKNLG